MNEQELRAVTGTVFNIQHFCLHDGPGIRTDVFVKGCPLHCIWCANPESQNPHPQIMYRKESCTGCTACVKVCPNNAIAMTPEGISRTDRSVCVNCGACAAVCAAKAREMTGHTATVGEVYDEVSQDVLFYGNDGGVTVTGGEALAHPEFTAALLELCQLNGIHTTIETCGFARWEVIEPILRHTDLVLFDNKEMDTEKHRAFTGAGNELILENLQKINNLTDCEIWVRVPCIPDCNDDAENIKAVGAYVSAHLHHCTQVHLLPYHRLGLSKAEQLEYDTEIFAKDVPSDAHMEELRDIIRSFGLLCK